MESRQNLNLNTLNTPKHKKVLDLFLDQINLNSNLYSTEIVKACIDIHIRVYNEFNRSYRLMYNLFRSINNRGHALLVIEIINDWLDWFETQEVGSNKYSYYEGMTLSLLSHSQGEITLERGQRFAYRGIL